MGGGGGNEWTKFTLLEMWGSSQYICDTKNIIFMSVENPSEKKILKNWTP